MKSLLLLPSEIIDLICLYLSGKDLCTSLCVCTSWHDEFIQRLYKKLTIRGEHRLEQVCSNLLHHSPVYLGNTVRILNLRIESISNRHLSQLGAWCPNVESLSLRWSIWHERELQQSPQQPQQRLGDIIDGEGDDDMGGAIALGSKEDIIRKEKYPGIMASFIGPFKNLSRLTLDVSFGKQKIKLPKFIPFLPRLVSLTLANGTHLSLDYIEYIHKMCPSLQHLSLQGTFIGSIPNMIIPVESTTTSTSSNPLCFNPATTILSVEMEFVIGSYEKYLDWLSYFAMKYPNMVSFHFRQYGMIVSPTDPSTISGPEQQINDNPMYDFIFTRLANGCQHLSNVHLYNIHIHPGFFNKLGPTLDHVSIHLPVFPTTVYLSSLFYHQGLQQHLTSLDLSLAVKNNNGQHYSTNQIVSVIGQLYLLKSLTLRWGNELSYLELDTLLEQFAHLTQLTLVGMKLGLLETTTRHTNTLLSGGTEETHQQSYPLQSLTLRGATLMDPHSLFLWIDHHTNLSNLNLAHSCRSLSSLNNQPHSCTIWLPTTRLDTFTITERRHQRNPIRLYMLHQTTGNNSTGDDLRPRFTDVAAGGGKHAWYFLKSFVHETLSSSQLVPLKSDQHFEWVVPYHDVKDACPWYADFCDTAYDVLNNQAMDKNMVDNIEGIEYMNIVCRSIGRLKITDHIVSFI
ncbi:hypothetical protein BC941DRAFT_431904 [Chlamydoabsidia padenii]|nr:hypothetical protein BC941DRAFT_431904 [Chlamydoabsidia padenii]